MRNNLLFLSTFILCLFFGIVISFNLNKISRVLGLASPNQNIEEIKIIFAGDLMFDRYIRQKAQQHGNDYIFADIKDLLLESDLAVANLEGSISNFASVSVNSEFASSNNYIFTFDPSVSKTLKDHNIRLVNIGNNHILNFGTSGLKQSKDYLNQENINYFGDTGNLDDKQFFIVEIKGLKIGFINYNQFVKGSKPRALDNIGLLKDQVDFLVLYTHWGVEYQTHANKNIQQLAHEFIDHGVDLVIGSHPHVVQQSEVYRGKTIYYSLGNFVFDQYFSENTKKGLLLEVTINSDSLETTFKEIPILLQSSGQTQL